MYIVVQNKAMGQYVCFLFKLRSTPRKTSNVQVWAQTGSQVKIHDFTGATVHCSMVPCELQNMAVAPHIVCVPPRICSWCYTCSTLSQAGRERYCI